MTYIAQEPGIVEAFTDQRGAYHPTREAAIDANFDYDWQHACLDIIENHDPKKRFQQIPVLPIADYVRKVIEEHPDMVRVILGDRDAT